MVEPPNFEASVKRLLSGRASWLVAATAATRTSLQAIVDDSNTTPVQVRSGDEALARVEAGEFAVVLIDIELPRLSGFEVAKAFADAALPVHADRTLVDHDIDSAQIEKGYDQYLDALVKPLSPSIVQSKLRGFGPSLWISSERARGQSMRLLGARDGRLRHSCLTLMDGSSPGTRVPSVSRDTRLRRSSAQHFSRFYPQEAIDRGWPEHELKVATEGRF